MLKWEIPVMYGKGRIGPGKVRHVDVQVPGVLAVWTEEYGEGVVATRKVRVYGTGHQVPDGREWVGTALDGEYVWHLYEDETS